MVDQEARRKYAELVRQFISGRMTNDEYEQRFANLRINKKDPAVPAIFNEVDDLCEDAYPDRLAQQWRLDNYQRRRVAQAVLFLQSDQEYQWPAGLWDGSAFLVTAFLVLLVFALFPETPFILRTGVAGILISIWVSYERWRAEQREKVGETEVWPFLHQADLAEAARHPRLLNGNRTTL